MTHDYSTTASNLQIKNRFDQELERFYNLETGQLRTIDAAMTMELCVLTASSVGSNATEILGNGCDAGNYTLKMQREIKDLNCSVLMLKIAEERVTKVTNGMVTTIQPDMKVLDLGKFGGSKYRQKFGGIK